jgi:short-subunit dehydrogenase
MISKPFSENVVVLTGASSGIGRHLAIQLAKQGARLALAARNVGKLKEIGGLCQQRGGLALVVPTDISQQSQCQSLIERTFKEYGKIDTLINNAGISMHSRFDDVHDVTMMQKVMGVNFFGSVFCTFYALPYLKQAVGRIVGISSYSGKFPSPLASGYGASKHAMAGFFDSLRVELKDFGVSVTMVYFSWIKTGISSRALGSDGRPLGKVRDQEKNAMPVEDSARLIIKAAAKRKRELLPLHGKLGLWMKLIFPAIVDRVSQKTLE